MAIVVLSTRARQRLGARIRFSTCWQTLLSFPSFSLGSRLLYVRRFEPMRVHVFLRAIIEPNEVTRADNVARNRSSAHSETSGAILIISTAHTVTPHELAIRTYRRRCVHHVSRLIPAAEFVNLGSAVEFGALVENLPSCALGSPVPGGSAELTFRMPTTSSTSAATLNQSSHKSDTTDSRAAVRLTERH